MSKVAPSQVRELKPDVSALQAVLICRTFTGA